MEKADQHEYHSSDYHKSMLASPQKAGVGMEKDGTRMRDRNCKKENVEQIT